MANDTIAEIIGPSGRVHYRRPVDDPLVEEAKKTPGYSVRLVVICPNCNDAASGEYEGPTCEVCRGYGYVESERS